LVDKEKCVFYDIRDNKCNQPEEFEPIDLKKRYEPVRPPNCEDCKKSVTTFQTYLKCFDMQIEIIDYDPELHNNVSG
jgi:hypothetical protein